MLQKLGLKSKTEKPTQSKAPEETANQAAKAQNSQDTENLQQVKLSSKKAGNKLTVLLVDEIKKLMDINSANEETIKNLQKQVNDLKAELEDAKNTINNYESRLGKMEGSMDKVLSLYEMVTNKYNPFVAQGDSEKTEQKGQTKEDVVKDVYLDTDKKREGSSRQNFQQGMENIQSIQSMQERESSKNTSSTNRETQRASVQSANLGNQNGTGQLPSQTLANYIMHQYQKGKPIDSIKLPLLKVGWDEGLVDQTIEQLELN